MEEVRCAVIGVLCLRVREAMCVIYAIVCVYMHMHLYTSISMLHHEFAGQHRAGGKCRKRKKTINDRMVGLVCAAHVVDTVVFRYSIRIAEFHGREWCIASRRRKAVGQRSAGMVIGTSNIYFSIIFSMESRFLAARPQVSMRRAQLPQGTE